MKCVRWRVSWITWPYWRRCNITPFTSSLDFVPETWQVNIELRFKLDVFRGVDFDTYIMMFWVFQAILKTTHINLSVFESQIEKWLRELTLGAICLRDMCLCASKWKKVLIDFSSASITSNTNPLTPQESGMQFLKNLIKCLQSRSPFNSAIEKLRSLATIRHINERPAWSKISKTFEDWPPSPGFPTLGIFDVKKYHRNAPFL